METRQLVHSDQLILLQGLAPLHDVSQMGLGHAVTDRSLHIPAHKPGEEH